MTKRIEKISGWGNYPQLRAQSLSASNEGDLAAHIKHVRSVVARGNGRSYGDSSLAANVLPMGRHNCFLDFNSGDGELEVQAGVLLSDILRHFVPHGWFLPVTPGTKFVTVGGAIASDVHGKNHHIDGCFSEAVLSFRLMLSDGSVVRCSRQENTELFRATCGGMGLTGVILDARIRLQRIQSRYILQSKYQAPDLQRLMELFEQYCSATYSVAWIDCLARGAALGRGIFTAGDFQRDGDLGYDSKDSLKLPLSWGASFFTRRYSVWLFNRLYYGANRSGEGRSHFESFFYPLDSIANWNTVYGKSGFVQYQLVVPKAVSEQAITEILRLTSRSQFVPALAVLKLHGRENANYLSFPLEGYSLAMDFRITSGLFGFLQELDKRVLEHGGRLYLAKDSRMSRQMFERGYPRLEKFRALRRQYGMEKIFESAQSRRLSI